MKRNNAGQGNPVTPPAAQLFPEPERSAMHQSETQGGNTAELSRRPHRSERGTKVERQETGAGK